MPNAGKIVRVGDSFSSWTFFNPVWTNFTLGNGTRGGKWRQMGENTIQWRAFLTFGSTSAFTGQLGITIPNSLTGYNDYQMLDLLAFHSGTGYTGKAQLVAGGGTTYPNFYGPSTLAWTATIPFTWANGDYLILNGTTETAP
jgi:hypothetical protein